ncbi:MAG: clostripain-related cysteine peptidase [Elusimicrobiaceae bacterium]|jgi:hypothetical protein
MNVLSKVLCAAMLLAPAVPSFAAAPAPQMVLPLPAKKWTVMVYMNGRNNLVNQVPVDLKEFMSVGSSNDVNIVAEVGRLTETTNIFYVGQMKLTSVLKFNRPDMGSYKHAAEFIKWTKQNFPAERYAFIMWGHGSGWKDSSESPEKRRGVSYDLVAKSYIKADQLNLLFALSGPIDLYISNACLMQSAEVAYQMRNGVRYLVGSQNEMPEHGFDFKALSRIFADNPQISARDAAIRVVQSYGQSVSPSFADRVGITMSAIDTSQLASLPRQLNALAALIKSRGDDPALAAAMHKAVRFTTGSTMSAADLSDFALNLTLSDTVYRDISYSVRHFLSDNLVIANVAKGGPGNRLAAAKGLSIELPFIQDFIDNGDTNYNSLELSKDSQWDEFIANIPVSREE